jgi:hypothetical protein
VGAGLEKPRHGSLLHDELDSSADQGAWCCSGVKVFMASTNCAPDCALTVPTLDKHRHLRGNIGDIFPAAKSLNLRWKRCLSTPRHGFNAPLSKRAPSTTRTSIAARTPRLRPGAIGPEGAPIPIEVLG